MYFRERITAFEDSDLIDLQQMSKGIEAEVGNKTTTVDVMDWFGRTALELVGQGGLGVSMDSLGDPTPNPLADSVKTLM